MEENNKTEIKPASGFDLLIYLAGGFGLLLLLGTLISPYFDVDNPGLGYTIAVLSVNFIALTGFTFAAGILRRKISWVQLGLKTEDFRPVYLLWALGIAIGLLPLRGAVAIAAQLIFEGGIESLNARADLFSAGGFGMANALVNIIGVGILAPAAEEFYFRGLLHNWFRQRWGAVHSIAASSMLFGIAHFDSIGVAVSAAIMGAAIGYAYEHSKSLWLPIAIHVVNNSIAVWMFLLFQLLVKSGLMPS